MHATTASSSLKIEIAEAARLVTEKTFDCLVCVISLSVELETREYYDDSTCTQVDLKLVL